MESLRRLKDSVLGIPENSSAKPNVVFIVKNLKEIERDIPNDMILGREIRKWINTCSEHFNI